MQKGVLGQLDANETSPDSFRGEAVSMQIVLVAVSKHVHRSDSSINLKYEYVYIEWNADSPFK